MKRILAIAPRLASADILSLSLLTITVLWLGWGAGLVTVWSKSEEYSHGPLVMLVLGYLIYMQRANLPSENPPAWLPLAALAPVTLFCLGSLIGSPQLEMYAVWLFVVLAVAALGGLALLRRLAVPLLIAFMVIPLPYGMESALTARLQLVSSQLGVWFIRLLGGVVYLQGNVIDMGGIKLLVAEACAGLRYLYPLMSLGALAAYMLRAPLWMKWVLFLSTIPITLLMNSLRIAATGMLVDRWGLGHTEGFLHFFEGWVVFLVALAVLLLLAKLLIVFLPGSPALLDTLSPTTSGSTSAAARTAPARGVALPVIAVAALVAALLGTHLTQRPEIPPARRPLAAFPATIEGWSATSYRLPPNIEAVAGATEYHYADYSSSAGTVNLYVSYYQTQREGRIPHSPKVCIPGDGWVIEQLQPVTLAGGAEANRLLLHKGERTLVAYYWLKQGSRTYREEVVAKLALILSAITERRTDGALVRLVTEVGPGEPTALADQRINAFAEALAGVLPNYVPD